ncbi:MAG: ATP-binding protein [Sedimentisphaerales bacterium]|nr:ATP-binding protein [Sedimentisphaerales bacterium]
MEKIAISTAITQLNQIADNFENWSKKERVRFVDPNGVCPPKITLTIVEDWVNEWLLKQRLIAVFFSHPNLCYGKDDFVLFLTTEQKEFHLIIDIFRLYKPDLATSLKESYDDFWEDVEYHINCHKSSKEVQLKARKGEILPSDLIGERQVDIAWDPVCFLDGAIATLIRRMRNITELSSEEATQPQEKGGEETKLATLALELAEQVAKTKNPLTNSKQSLTSTFEPIRNRIDKYCDSLERKYPNLFGSVRRKYEDFVKRLKEYDDAITKPDFEKAELILDGLKYALNNLEEALKETAKEIKKPQGKGGEKEINSQFLSLAKVSVKEIIKRGEGHYIEFKASLEYDIDKNQHNKDLSKECLKTIAALLNADGGVLLIGVRDDGTIIGIEKDLQHVKNNNTDGFELRLRDLIRNYLKPFPHGKIECFFEKFNQATICRVNIEPLNRSQIVYMENNLYVREGNTTINLKNTVEIADWIQQREQTVSVIHENHNERNQRTESGLEMPLYEKDGITNHKTEQDFKEKQEVPLEPKPPEFLQKILWYRLHGRKYWKLILVAILLLLGASLFVLPQFNIIILISRIIKSIHS